MNYTFQVDYIHNSFIEAHPTMHENHPVFIAATSHTELHLQYGPETSIEEIRGNILTAMALDNCKVLKLEGGLVE